MLMHQKAQWIVPNGGRRSRAREGDRARARWTVSGADPGISISRRTYVTAEHTLIGIHLPGTGADESTRANDTVADHHWEGVP